MGGGEAEPATPEEKTSPLNDGPNIEGNCGTGGTGDLSLDGGVDLTGLRPTDDQIIQQENAIRAEQAEHRELVGKKEPLQVLAAEYERGSAVYTAKIEGLNQTYSHIRRTRGDGNCFFRAFLFRYLESILEAADREEVERVKKCLVVAHQSLEELGYERLTLEDFQEALETLLDATLPGPDFMSEEGLLARCRDNGSNFAVMDLRFVTSAEVQKRSEVFEPFIMGMSDMDVMGFCKKSVEVFGEEGDHVHIQALTDALVVPVRVVYLDGSGGVDGSVNHYDFIPEGSSMLARSIPRIALLYRPGHYDILYAR